MQDSLKTILDIQELDMKMIRLMRLKKERAKELEQIGFLRVELHEQLIEKEKELQTVSDLISNQERKLEEVQARIKKLESQQMSIKKVDEFNAITQELTSAERERVSLEQKLSDLVDKKVAEEDILEKVKDSLKTSEASSLALEDEIRASIGLINNEGLALKQTRDNLALAADDTFLQIYERLLRNKKDRVVVPVENRTCSGCHIVLTAQHENLVRKGADLVFCEHCSRVHYWPEQEELEAAGTVKRRRRKVASS